jgi:hypothetical protein
MNLCPSNLLKSRSCGGNDVKKFELDDAGLGEALADASLGDIGC